MKRFFFQKVKKYIIPLIILFFLSTVSFIYLWRYVDKQNQQSLAQRSLENALSVSIVTSTKEKEEVSVPQIVPIRSKKIYSEKPEGSSVNEGLAGIVSFFDGKSMKVKEIDLGSYQPEYNIEINEHTKIVKFSIDKEKKSLITEEGKLSDIQKGVEIYIATDDDFTKNNIAATRIEYNKDK